MHGRCHNKSILIVEDHPLVATATQFLLKKIDPTLTITICGCARTAMHQFLHSAEWFRIFLDLDVPGAYGLSLARQFCELGAANRCAVITAFDNPMWTAEAKTLGMLGYITKSMPFENLYAALKQVLDGRRVFPAHLAPPPPATRLTRRQQDVLFLLHRGYSSKQIAAQLKVAEGTVDNHVAGLLRALGVSNRAHAIAKAMQLGYLHVQGLSSYKTGT